MNKKLLIIAFVIISLFQIYFPLDIILQKEDILKNGKEYKFEIKLLEPYDKIEKQYIYLNFKENNILVLDDKDWEWEETIYILLENDKKGFAKAKSVSKNKPKSDDFVKAQVLYADDKELFFNYSFSKYFFQKKHIKKAKKIYLKHLRDSNNVVYAVVKAKEGEAILKDVMVNKTSFKDLLD